MIRVLLALALIVPTTAFAKGTWTEHVKKEIAAADRDFPGDIGLYVRRLDDGSTLSVGVDRPWYLSSTTKIPIAIVLMREIEAGRLSLKQEVTLRRSDFVDGAGPVIWKKPGEKMTVEYLLRQMLEKSDSTATDILIRLIGVERLNEGVRQLTEGIGPLTTIVDVRYGAYGELHPQAAKLTNMDFIELKKTPIDRRHEAFAKKIGVKPKDLKYGHVNEAFEKFYESGKNAGRLDAFAGLLARLAKGELLKKSSTERILAHMEAATTGEKRLKAGFPADWTFAQKTGTQVGRACNVGVVRPAKGRSFVVAACMENFEDIADAEKAFARIGAALAASGVSR